MADTVVMTKKESENTTSLYRRFVKHFRTSGVQTVAKRKRFYSRRLSKNVRKKDCINRLVKKESFERAYRLGKISTLQKK